MGDRVMPRRDRKDARLLRIIINLLLFALIFRAVSLLFGGARRALRGRARPKPNPRPEAQDSKQPYSDLSPYEIEDAEYEELRPGDDSPK
jgi:hypothetical protein